MTFDKFICINPVYSVTENVMFDVCLFFLEFLSQVSL